jgi:hypothetical protein
MERYPPKPWRQVRKITLYDNQRTSKTVVASTAARASYKP